MNLRTATAATSVIFLSCRHHACAFHGHLWQLPRHNHLTIRLATILEEPQAASANNDVEMTEAFLEREVRSLTEFDQEIKRAQMEGDIESDRNSDKVVASDKNDGSDTAEAATEHKEVDASATKQSGGKLGIGGTVLLAAAGLGLIAEAQTIAEMVVVGGVSAAALQVGMEALQHTSSNKKKKKRKKKKNQDKPLPQNWAAVRAAAATNPVAMPATPEEAYFIDVAPEYAAQAQPVRRSRLWHQVREWAAAQRVPQPKSISAAALQTKKANLDQEMDELSKTVEEALALAAAETEEAPSAADLATTSDAISEPTPATQNTKEAQPIPTEETEQLKSDQRSPALPNQDPRTQDPAAVLDEPGATQTQIGVATSTDVNHADDAVQQPPLPPSFAAASIEKEEIEFLRLEPGKLVESTTMVAAPLDPATIPTQQKAKEAVSVPANDSSRKGDGMLFKAALARGRNKMVADLSSMFMDELTPPVFSKAVVGSLDSPLESFAAQTKRTSIAPTPSEEVEHPAQAEPEKSVQLQAEGATYSLKEAALARGRRSQRASPAAATYHIETVSLSQQQAKNKAETSMPFQKARADSVDAFKSVASPTAPTIEKEQAPAAQESPAAADAFHIEAVSLSHQQTKNNGETTMPFQKARADAVDAFESVASPAAQKHKPFVAALPATETPVSDADNELSSQITIRHGIATGDPFEFPRSTPKPDLQRPAHVARVPMN